MGKNHNFFSHLNGMIFVDRLREYPSEPYGYRYWCHMMTDNQTADGLGELHAMAERIGLRREFFQNKPRLPHYDLTSYRRHLALLAGACDVPSKQLVQRCARTDKSQYKHEEGKDKTVNENAINTLKRLLATPGPSGDESSVGKLWRNEARTFADSVRADAHGNSFALLNGKGPRVLLAGHIDEIGLMVNYIDDDGYLYVQPIGGWDEQVLVGQRIRLLGHAGDVLGVVGKKPIHVQDSDERSNASKIKHLWVDLGVKNRAEALERVRVGCVGVIDAPIYELPHKRLVSRSLDNRIGAYVVLEVLRRLATNRPIASVAAVATTYEEISSAGAAVAAFSFEPHVALVVDATYSTDIPELSKKEFGDVCLGKGPVLSRGSATSPLVYDRLVHLAEQHNISYSLQPAPGFTGTDADVIHMVRSGIATATVSIAMRYLHTPNEMIELSDVEQTIRLLELFITSVQTDTDFIPDV